MFKAVAGYYKDNERLRLLVKIIAVWLISRAVMLLMVPVMNLIADEPHQWLYYMNPWDAEWYKGIVENGYQPPKSSGMASWAFFPLYPLVCMAVRLVTMGSIDTYAVGMTVSNICIIIAVYYAVKYADIELDMKKYNKKNGWYVNWASLAEENEIYALVVEGSVDIQGLVAVAPDKDMRAMYIAWMCTSPDNNKLLTDDVRYFGVGGHLFAIAAQKSVDYGYDGYVYGFAANKELLDHYVQVFNGEVIGVLHPYQFAIDESNAKKIMEVYDYDWTDEEV